MKISGTPKPVTKLKNEIPRGVVFTWGAGVDHYIIFRGDAGVDYFVNFTHNTVVSFSGVNPGFESYVEFPEATLHLKG